MGVACNWWYGASSALYQNLAGLGYTELKENVGQQLTGPTLFFNIINEETGAVKIRAGWVGTCLLTGVVVATSVSSRGGVDYGERLWAKARALGCVHWKRAYQPRLIPKSSKQDNSLPTVSIPRPRGHLRS